MDGIDSMKVSPANIRKSNEQPGSSSKARPAIASNKREGNSMQIFTFVHTRDYRLGRKISLSLSLSCEKKWRIICISNGNIETHFPDITFYPSSNYYIYIYIDETDSFNVIPSMLITIISHLFRPGYIQEGIVKSGGSFNRAERELVYRVDNNRFSFPFFFSFY